MDISHGQFRDLSALSGLVCLESLVADSNMISDADLPNLPGIPGLKTLSLNHNAIQSLLAFIGFVNVKYPALVFVSLLGNMCCPSEVSGGSEEQYSAYRLQLVLSLNQVRNSPRMLSSARAASRRFIRLPPPTRACRDPLCMQLGWIDSASTALDRTDSHGQMSCHGLHAVTIPSWVNAAKHTALGLDFSSGCLVDISSLCSFLYLQTLVLDHNQLKSIRLLPALPTLRALSLNDNELEELHSTLISIQKKCGNITFLSLLGNPCYPCELSSTSYLTQRAYEKHRAMVRLPAHHAWMRIPPRRPCAPLQSEHDG